MENLGDAAAEIHAGDKLVNLIPYPVLTTPVEVVEELAGEQPQGRRVWVEREKIRAAEKSRLAMERRTGQSSVVPKLRRAAR